MTIDPRDEALFERYFSVLLHRFAQPINVRREDVTAVRRTAEQAVAEHRALFPLLGESAIYAPLGPAWRFVIATLWRTNLDTANVANLSTEHPGDVIEAEIIRLLNADIIYARPDGTLAIAAPYRTADPAESLAAVAAALGGGA